MNRRNLGIISIVILALIVIGGALWLKLGPNNQSRQVQTASSVPILGTATVGEPAPEFTAATTQGLVDLATATKPIFLEVFATWCPHCQRETVVINKLYAAFKSQIQFVAVSGDVRGMDGTSPASQLDVLNFQQRFNVQYPIAYDGTLGVAKLYLQQGFPTIVIIGRDKKITYITSGETPYDTLAAQLRKVLK